MQQVTFRGRRCDIKKKQYDNGRLALLLTIAEGEPNHGEPMAVATVNLPEQTIPEPLVFIKDYAENEGILDALMGAGIVSEPLGFVPSGFVEIPVCEYLGE